MCSCQLRFVRRAGTGSRSGNLAVRLSQAADEVSELPRGDARSTRSARGSQSMLSTASSLPTEEAIKRALPSHQLAARSPDAVSEITVSSIHDVAPRRPMHGLHYASEPQGDEPPAPPSNPPSSSVSEDED